KPAPAKEEAKEEAAGKGLTAEQVETMLRDALRQHATTQQTASQREAFAAKRLGKLPEVYRRQLGDDPDKWDAEAKAIQQQFEADVKGLGVTLETLGSPAADGGTPPAKEKPDLSKLPAFERLALGMEALPVMPATAAGESK